MIPNPPHKPPEKFFAFFFPLSPYPQRGPRVPLPPASDPMRGNRIGFGMKGLLYQYCLVKESKGNSGKLPVAREEKTGKSPAVLASIFPFPFDLSPCPTTVPKTITQEV